MHMRRQRRRYILAVKMGLEGTQVSEERGGVEIEICLHSAEEEALARREGLVG